MTSSPPTRAKSPHAAEGPRLPNPGNSGSTPYHDGCRPQSWWLRHDDRGRLQTTQDAHRILFLLGVSTAVGDCLRTPQDADIILISLRRL